MGITAPTRTRTLACTRTLRAGVGFHAGKQWGTLGYTRGYVRNLSD